MTDYRGAASESSRAAILVKKREKQREELERLKKKIQEVRFSWKCAVIILAIQDNDVTSGGKFASVEDKYSTHYDSMEEQLVSNTVGKQRHFEIGLLVITIFYVQLFQCAVAAIIGLVTLEEMKTRREALVQEREKKLAANLTSDGSDAAR